jgi:hypothetical protein
MTSHQVCHANLETCKLKKNKLVTLSLIGGVNVTLMIDVSADQCFKYILRLIRLQRKKFRLHLAVDPTF